MRLICPASAAVMFAIALYMSKNLKYASSQTIWSSNPGVTDSCPCKTRVIATMRPQLSSAQPSQVGRFTHFSKKVSMSGEASIRVWNPRASATMRPDAAYCDWIESGTSESTLSTSRISGTSSMLSHVGAPIATSAFRHVDEDVVERQRGLHIGVDVHYVQPCLRKPAEPDFDVL